MYITMLTDDDDDTRIWYEWRHTVGSSRRRERLWESFASLFERTLLILVQQIFIYNFCEGFVFRKLYVKTY